MIVPTPYSINITAPKRKYGPTKSSKTGGDSANRNYYRAGRRKKFGKGPGPAVIITLSDEAMGIEVEKEPEYFIYDRTGRLKKCGV